MPREDAGVSEKGIDAGQPTEEQRGRKRQLETSPIPSQLVPTQPLPTTNVWAFRIGNYKPNPAGGWTHAIRFSGLDDLIEKLKQASLQGRLSKLVINAHGNKAGLIQLDHNLEIDNVTSFAEYFNKLSTFLIPNGMLLFHSCQAGGGAPGTLLLSRISSYMQPGQYIIGYSVSGQNSGSYPALAGDVFEAPNSMPDLPIELYKKGERRRLNENSIYAKWAQNGRVIRLPLEEEISRLKGLWTVIAATRNTKSERQFKDVSVKITLDTFELTKGDKRIWSGTYRIDINKIPRTIDINYTFGKDKGKTSFGLLRFGEADFDSLTICLADPARERPDAFTSLANSGRLLLELKRVLAR